VGGAQSRSEVSARAAIDLARESGITLVGFVRGDTFNAYAQPARIGC
jgi:formate dehydrogenase assembly factor FdhD